MPSHWQYNVLAEETIEELRLAQEKYPALHSMHEGYGVLVEELAEFFDEVRKQERDKEQARDELIQIAAMAWRTILDLEL